jgi:hypothetical protein
MLVERTEIVEADVAGGLAETISALRMQLTTAMSSGRAEDILFELGDVQIEFEVAVTKDASADGGVRFWVISFGAKAGVATEGTHRIALTLKPVTVDAHGVATRALVADRLAQTPG